MATERLSMRKAREILRLKELKRSHREISRALGVGVATVSEVAARAKLARLPWTTIARARPARRGVLSRGCCQRSLVQTRRVDLAQRT